MKSIVIFMSIVIGLILGGCSHSLANRSEAENTINASIETVWETALFVIPKNNLDIDYMNKTRWFLKAGKAVGAFDWGQNLTIQFKKLDESHTIASMTAETHYGRIPNIIAGLFDEIKVESEKQALQHKSLSAISPVTLERAKKCRAKGGIWVNDLCQMQLE